MFERFTDKARGVIFCARKFASESGSPVIEPEHLLLGVFEQEPVLFRAWLKSPAEVDAFRLAAQGEKTGAEPIPDSVDMPLTVPSKRVLAYAAEEAERFRDAHIRPSHFLAGLLREEGTAAGKTLAAFGIQIQQVRLVFVASLKAAAHPRPENERLHSLVDQLPTHQIARARHLLEALIQAGGESPNRPVT